jgi:uncharacterized membrane protein
MRNELEASPPRTPIVRRAFAGLILVLAAALALKIVVGLVMAVFWFVVGVAVVIAVLWALKTIFW